MDGLQPFLPGCFGHGCAQRAVSHQQVGGIGSPFAGLAVAGFTGSAKFQHIAQHGNAAAAGAGAEHSSDTTASPWAPARTTAAALSA